MHKDQLVKLAFEAREKSYSPYSNFRVGAALLAGSGRIYLGGNVENASYGASICAERSAAMQALAEGERVFKEIAIVGFHKDAAPSQISYAYPCGICRQFLNEFADPDMKVYVAKNQEDVLETTLKEMLPYSFGPNDLL